MPRIKIGRYKDPESVGYLGWIETDEWIIWVGVDGNLSIGTDRAENGAVASIQDIEM
jgi:hypothetical protein